MFFNLSRKTTPCPNCISQWDGYRCICCGYIEKLAKRKPELLIQIRNLFYPKIYEPYLLYREKQIIPERLGVYAWYFDNLFDTYFAHNNQSVIRIDPKWFLLYIGIAKDRTLRDRIHGDHLNQNSEGSTLRQSLAALLWKDIDLDASKQLNGENEKMKLNNWIFRHAVVAWTETNKPKVVENLMLHEFGHLLYLNIENNKKNPNRKILKQLRKLWRKGK